MTILVHHRAVWEIARDKTYIGTYMRVARFSSVTQSFPTLCDPMDTRPPCLSPTPGAYSHSCPSSRWCHWTTSLPVIPFSCLRSFPETGSFPMSLFITSVRVASRVRVSSHSEVASNPPNPREWLVILSTGWSCLASSGFWSCLESFHLSGLFLLLHPPWFKKTLLLSTLKIYFSLYKVGGVGEKQPFSVPTLSPLSSGNKVLRQLKKLRLQHFQKPSQGCRASESDHGSDADGPVLGLRPPGVPLPSLLRPLSSCFHVAFEVTL